MPPHTFLMIFLGVSRITTFNHIYFKWGPRKSWIIDALCINHYVWQTRMVPLHRQNTKKENTWKETTAWKGNGELVEKVNDRGSYSCSVCVFLFGFIDGMSSVCCWGFCMFGPTTWWDQPEWLNNNNNRELSEHGLATGFEPFYRKKLLCASVWKPLINTQVANAYRFIGLRLSMCLCMCVCTCFLPPPPLLSLQPWAECCWWNKLDHNFQLTLSSTGPHVLLLSEVLLSSPLTCSLLFVVAGQVAISPCAVAPKPLTIISMVGCCHLMRLHLAVPWHQLMASIGHLKPWV